MRKLVLATHNPGKVAELQAMLAAQDVFVLSLADLGDLAEVVEDGETFEANALKKARAAFDATGLPALADDSGLAVDALGGRPGVQSARYGGPGLSDEERVTLLLHELAGLDQPWSPGRFHCAMALIDRQGAPHLRTAVWEGIVTGPPKGANGFGYDPIFLLPDRGMTSAELPPEDKNRLSHRGRALQAVLQLLRERPGLLG